MVDSEQRTSPLKKHPFDENLKSYCISFFEHGSTYNFYNSQEVVSKLLMVFGNNFIPAPRDGFAEITDSRIWQTNVYDGVYFNDFIKSNLSNNILKRVIMNGMSGSGWRFERFDRICITVNSDYLRSIGK